MITDLINWRSSHKIWIRVSYKSKINYFTPGRYKP